MTEQAVVELINKLKAELREGEKELSKSPEHKKLKERLEEIESLDETEELKQEKEQLEEQDNDMYNSMVLNVISSLSQEDILTILSYINSDFIANNHIAEEEFLWKKDPFATIIIALLEKLDDKDCTICNSLLANKTFINAMEYSERVIEKLISKTNSEESYLTFLKTNSTAFKIMSYDMTIPNWILINQLLCLLESENYSNEFKISVLCDIEVLRHLNEESITELFKSDKMTKNQKIELIEKVESWRKIKSGVNFSIIMANLCSSYQNLRAVLKDDAWFERIDVMTLLTSIKFKLTLEQLKEILYEDRIISKIESWELGRILAEVNMDFETRKNIIFDEKIYDKLDHLAITEILTSSHLTLKERTELLYDERIIPNLTDMSELINDVLATENIPIEEKLNIIRSPIYMNHISSRTIQEIMADPSLPIETATEILFDKRFFYRLIDEYHEDYNKQPGSFGEQESYRYDKYEYVKRLYEKNPFLARTFSYALLKDEILDLGFEFIEKMSKYSELAEQLATRYNYGEPTYPHMLKSILTSKYTDQLDPNLFVTKLISIAGDNSYYEVNPKKRRKLSIIRNTAKLDYSQFTEENWRTFTEIGLRDMSIYKNWAESSVEIQFEEEIDYSLNILPDVETMEDLNHYTERRMKLCDDVFRECIAKKDLDGAKNAYFNKYFSINIQEAQEIVRMYGHTLEELRKKPEYILQVKYIEQIKRILEIEKLSIITACYNDPSIEPITFDEILYMDQSIRQMYSKEMSDSVYKIGEKEEPTYITVSVEENGITVEKTVPVYEPGFEFKMLVHSTAAYGKMTLINNNYDDSWNLSDRKQNHGICCSLIANDNLGMAEINDVLFGFDSWDPKAVTKSAPYDIYSENDSYDIKEGRPLTFMTAQGIINNTRHTHNEQVLERTELRPNKQSPKSPNIQPSYVIICSDMTDEIKQKAIKCSEELHIPIVYIDKEKIVHHEVEKIDQKINEFNHSTDINRKIELLEQILISHENNRSGLRASNKDMVEQYFPTRKVEILFEKIIEEIQVKYQETNNIEEYEEYASKIIELLDRENEKFIITMETIERANYIDIPVDNYKTRIMSQVDNNIGKNNEPKLLAIMKEYQEENPDLPITQVFASIDSKIIEQAINDLQSKGLYQENGKRHNIGHIERVILLSQLIGRQELVDENNNLDERALELLTTCAKYHDVGKTSDKIEQNHSIKSAEMLKEMVQDDGFTEEEKAIMQVAIEFHDVEFDMYIDYKFREICDKYNIPDSKREYARKIADCLKDANTLDRTRVTNLNANLMPICAISLESSVNLIKVAEMINRIYDNYDYKQFKKKCRQKKNNHGLVDDEKRELQAMMDDLGDEPTIRSDQNGKRQ